MHKLKWYIFSKAGSDEYDLKSQDDMQINPTTITPDDTAEVRMHKEWTFWIVVIAILYKKYEYT